MSVSSHMHLWYRVEQLYWLYCLITIEDIGFLFINTEPFKSIHPVKLDAGGGTIHPYN